MKASGPFISFSASPLNVFFQPTFPERTTAMMADSVVVVGIELGR